MPRFQYRARTGEGREVKGTLRATSKRGALELLRKNQLVPLQVDEQSRSSILHKTLWGGVGGKDLVMFSRQLASMISAGVTIVEALKAMQRQVTKPALQDLLQKIIYDIEGGESFSQAIGKYPATFSMFYLGVVRSGEASGRLSESLGILADYLETDYAFMRKVRSALAYPLFVLVLVAIVVSLMFIFVIPQLVILFKDANVRLPLPTRVLIWTTNLFTGYWYIFALIAVVLGLLFRSYIRTPEGKFVVSTWLLRVPFINVILQKIYLARLTSVLNTLFSSDVPIIESLNIAKFSIGNEVYQRILEGTAEAVKDGASISKVWSAEPFIPPMLATMVAVGERTGEVSKAFSESQRFFRRDVEEILDSIVVFLEPVLVIILGVGVAFVVAGVLLPIYDLVLVI